MCSSDLDRVHASDGVQQVVCLIDDDYIPLQLDPNSLTGGSMEQGVVGENNKLGERERLLVEESKQPSQQLGELTMPEYQTSDLQTMSLDNIIWRFLRLQLHN